MPADLKVVNDKLNLPCDELHAIVHKIDELTETLNRLDQSILALIGAAPRDTFPLPNSETGSAFNRDNYVTITDMAAEFRLAPTMLRRLAKEPDFPPGMTFRSKQPVFYERALVNDFLIKCLYEKV